MILKKNPFHVALTGGIGCGKSLALQCFCRCGAAVFSADAIAAEVRDGESMSQKILDLFGDEVADGASGRIRPGVLAGKVFSDPGARAALEALLHPEIRRRIMEMTAAADAEITVTEVPLLFECGWQGDFDCTTAVWSDRKTALERIPCRNWDEAEYLRRAAAQLPAEKKLEMADFGLVNNGTAESLMRQCADLMAFWKHNMEVACNV